MTSPVKVSCPIHGTVPLTHEQYRTQLDHPEQPWACPVCAGLTASQAKRLECGASQPTADYSHLHECTRERGHTIGPHFCGACEATFEGIPVPPPPELAGTTRADAADQHPETCDWSWENRNRTGGDHTCKRAVGHGGPHLCNCGAVDNVPVPTLPPILERLTVEKHRQRHVELHQAFEELLSDYLTQNPKAYPSKTPLLDLLRWSHEQAIRPTEPT